MGIESVVGKHPAARVVGKRRLGHHNLRVRTLGLSLILIVTATFQIPAAARAASPATDVVPQIQPLLQVASSLVSSASDGAGISVRAARIVAAATSTAGAPRSIGPTDVRTITGGDRTGGPPATAPAPITTVRPAADRHHVRRSGATAPSPRPTAALRSSRDRLVRRSRLDPAARGLEGVFAVAIRQLDAIQTQTPIPPGDRREIPILTSWLVSLARLAPVAGSATAPVADRRARRADRMTRPAPQGSSRLPGLGSRVVAVASTAGGSQLLALSPAIAPPQRAGKPNASARDHRVRRVRRAAPAVPAASAAWTPPVIVALDSAASAVPAGGGAGPGSSAIVIVTALGMSLLQLLSSRLSLELGPWRSAVFSSRLERPG